MPAAAAPAAGREVRNIVHAVAWMLSGGVSFAAMIMFVRALTDTISAFELAFWRALIGCAIMLPLMLQGDLRHLRTRRLGAHGLRSVVQYLGIALWFYAIADINLSEGMALQFTVPLFTIAMVAAFFKERVGVFRWAITLFGFAGVLVVLRPGFEAVTPVAVITLVSAAFYAAANTVAKSLQRTESSETIVFYMNLMHVPMALVPALFVWSGPGLADWPAVIGMSVTASLAHYCLAQAMRLVPISIIMPIDFMKLPLVAVFAWIFFGEPTNPWAWLGGAIIFGATWVLMRRETRRARAADARAAA
jgi:drug/metabolite transporter (DMT)-like permease